MIVLSFLVGMTGLFLLGGILYLLFWAVAYLTWRKEPSRLPAPPRLRFVFVVPAHDEERDIAHTLESLKRVDYPPELFEVVVIADNCSDNTADVVRGLSVRCLERVNPDLRGKGYALRFAFNRLLKEDFDAFVIIDADTVVDADFLRVMNERLLAGDKAVQAYYGLSNPDVNPLTYVLHVGNVMENLLFYAGKARLGVSAILRGNGMCFSREVLEDNPWDSFSVVEDTEYTLRLIRKGIEVPFTAETRVLAKMPENLSQARTQRIRWASGNLRLTRRNALKLIREGIVSNNVSLTDMGVSFLVMSKPLLLLLSLMLGGAALAVGILDREHQTFGWMLGLLPAALMSIYLLMGIAVTGLNPRRFLCLLWSPWYLGWLFIISLIGLAGYKGNLWLRTGRT